jgi:uncharacterized membrane protein
MSESDSPQDPNPRATGKLINVLLILLGVVALLPGLCSVFFIATGGPNPIVGVGLIIGFGGVVMLGMALGAFSAEKMSNRQTSAAAGMLCSSYWG